METCDISLVKEETVELIKTETQNEDEFDICGQSGIKTEEDSNMAGDFKDTINYEAQNFQTSDTNMKSMWDDFLPIREHIKKESDAPYNVDGVVKTEMNFYDSCEGIMKSTPDHFTLDNKYQIKLEQDQSALSREMLESHLVEEARSDFNLNIKCVKENQELSFNAKHKETDLNNTLLKNKINNLKCKTIDLLNFDQKGKYSQVEKDSYNKSVYKSHVCSDNLLMAENFKNNGENNKKSRHPESGGFCRSRSPGATRTKSRLAKYTTSTRRRGHCTDYVRRICKTENCTKKVQVGGHCITHGGERKCKTKDCTKKPQGSHCSAHGGGWICKTENCTKHALKGGHCIAHGGGRICKTKECTKRPQVGGHCSGHGGGWICKTESCTKHALKGGHCFAHGGGRICKIDKCNKHSKKDGFCFAHGEERKCITENCTKYAQLRGHCFVHGGGRKCKIENCTKQALKGGHCFAHGGGRGSKCKTEDCTKYSQVGGHCNAHGGGRKCKTENCTKNAKVRGHCIAHGVGNKYKL